MQFLNILENNLNRTFNRFAHKRYSNNISKINFLNKDLGLSYKCIGEYCGKEAAAVHHWTTGVNSLSNPSTIQDIDKLLQFVLTTFDKQIEEKKGELKDSNYKDLKQLIMKGEILLKPHLRNAKTKQARLFKSTS
jgi:hypothetical protein